MLFAKNGCQPPLCWVHDDFQRDEKGNTVALYLA